MVLNFSKVKEHLKIISFEVSSQSIAISSCPFSSSCLSCPSCFFNVIESNDFVDIDGLTKAEDILEKVRAKYEQFGQVTFKNIELDADGNLKSFRVNIQQTNGDLKETRNFLMEISDDAKKVKFSDDTIKGTENVVRHLNEQKDATDQIIKEEEKIWQELLNN